MKQHTGGSGSDGMLSTVCVTETEASAPLTSQTRSCSCRQQQNSVVTVPSKLDLVEMVLLVDC